MTNQYVGEIRMFAGTFAPQNWQFCDGSIVAISEYEVLFELIGTTYGGDGESTFALPNLGGRIPFHVGPGNVFADAGGAESITPTRAGLPSHTHHAGASNSGTSTSPTGHVFAGYGDTPFATDSPDVSMDGSAIAQIGNSQPFENRPPFTALNFIIAVAGIFPSS
jgi:microcystin-dependent protein